MDYQLPICDCGQELLVQCEVTAHKYYKVNKNGLMSKRETKWSNDTWMTNGIEYLYCSKCTKGYEIDYDDKDRILRGDQVI